MDYKEWAEEYFAEAEKIKPLMEKYEKLQQQKGINQEKINKMALYYSNQYYDLLSTGNMLLGRHNGEDWAKNSVIGGMRFDKKNDLKRMANNGQY